MVLNTGVFLPKALCIARRAVPSLRCSKWLPACVAGWSVNADPVVEQRVGIRFLESGDSLVCDQGLMAEPVRIGFRERTLVQFSIGLDLVDCVCEQGRDFLPLVISEHREFYLTAPTIDRLRHVGFRLIQFDRIAYYRCKQK